VCVCVSETERWKGRRNGVRRRDAQCNVNAASGVDIDVDKFTIFRIELLAVVGEKKEGRRE